MSGELVSRETGRLVPVHDVVGQLSAPYVDVLEQRVRVMREDFRCPPRVASAEEFRGVLSRFYAHYERTLHGAGPDAVFVMEDVYVFTKRFLHGDLGEWEKNAVRGRDGGMIGVIDAITDALVKQQTDAYLDRVLWEFIPTDHHARLQLAEALLAEYGPRLSPGDDRIPAFALANNLEGTLKGLANMIRSSRRDWSA